MATLPAPILPLHTWAAVRSELLWIHERPVDPTARSMETDFRETSRAWLLTEGWGRVTAKNGKTWRAQAGQWLFLPTLAGHQEFSENARLLSVHFIYHWPDGAPFFREREGLVLPAAEHPELERTARALLRSVRKQLGETWIDYAQRASTLAGFLGLQRAFLAWLEAWSDVLAADGRTLARALPDDARLARAVLRINETPIHEPYPVADLAKITGLSASQTDRLFLSAYGLTPRRYHERRRVEAARLMLGTGETAVKAVASHLGFRHAAQFTQWFKRHNGCAPVEFKERGKT